MHKYTLTAACIAVDSYQSVGMKIKLNDKNLHKNISYILFL